MKGIFPKDPKKKFKGTNKTYYYLKDIKFLSHERLLQKFRDISTYNRKIKKAINKNEKYDAKVLKENRPTYNLDHILKERYPRFIDAIYDLDDALSLINLFSTLPKQSLLAISSEVLSSSTRLSHEFSLYCAIAKNIKKAFISIKGIYVTCELQGQEITWLMPYNIPQKHVYDVDYNIMLSFLELYISLLKFVNLKLFKDIGIDYPLEGDFDRIFLGFNSSQISDIQNNVNESFQEKRELNVK